MKMAKPRGIDKYHLSLAGEYRVCAELLKREIFATVTFGNMKSADVVAFGRNHRATIIEVKSANSGRFVTGLYQKYKTPEKEHPAFWVLYCVTPHNSTFSEQFFVLSHEEMAMAQGRHNEEWHRNHGRLVDNPAPLTYEQLVKLANKGVDNVLTADVQQHKDAWEKIVRHCTE
jgi:hypothetical protein